MAQGWTTDRVVQLSPDPSSLKAAQGLTQIKKWVTVGRDDRAVWGECQGSGAKPYQVQFDLSEAASKCSCPSRKFPCKHILGLMLIFTSSPEAIAGQTAPARVEEWIAGRLEKAKKKQEKVDAPPKPVDAEAQADRREKRLARIGEGLAALKIWSADLLRTGIATVPSKGFALFDEPARRMIDAQAPGVATRVRRLGDIAVAGAGWNRPFVQSLASLHLLIRAYERLDSLPESTREDVLATLGVPPASQDPAALTVISDTWQVLAQEVELEDRLRVQRTWLFGRRSKRPALVLAFAHGTAPLDSTLAPAMAFEGEISFFPGNGLRAEVKSRGDLTPLDRLHGFQTLDEFCNAAGANFAQQPWLDEVAAPLLGLTPVKLDNGWAMVDRDRRSLPAALSDSAGWLALAVSGGHPVDVAAGYDGRRLRPMAMILEGEYVSLVNANQRR
jgi:hypothetical protein